MKTIDTGIEGLLLYNQMYFEMNVGTFMNLTMKLNLKKLE